MPEFPTIVRRGFPLLRAVPDDGEPKRLYVVTFDWPMTMTVEAKDEETAKSLALSVKPMVETWHREPAVKGICAGWVQDVVIKEMEIS